MAFPTSAELTDTTTTKSEMVVVFDNWLKACRQLPGADSVSGLYISGGILIPTRATHRILNEGDASSDDITNIDITNVESGAELVLYKSSAVASTTIVHAAGGAGEIRLLRKVNRLLPASSELLAIKLILIDTVWYELDFYSSNLKSSSTDYLVGYAGGTGGVVVQDTSRSSSVAINKPTGRITLYSAAGSSTPTTFRVVNSVVTTLTPVVVNQSTGSNRYATYVTRVGSGYFDITFLSVLGTTVDTPDFIFTVFQGQEA